MERKEFRIKEYKEHINLIVEDVTESKEVIRIYKNVKDIDFDALNSNLTFSYYENDMKKFVSITAHITTNMRFYTKIS